MQENKFVYTKGSSPLEGSDNPLDANPHDPTRIRRF